MVFTGLTRDGITGGNFRTKGTAKEVRGSWDSYKINYQAMNARGRELANMLLYVNAAEWAVLSKLIQDKFFPYYIELHQSGKKLPGLEDLPILAQTV